MTSRIVSKSFYGLPVDPMGRKFSDQNNQNYLNFHIGNFTCVELRMKIFWKWFCYVWRTHVNLFSSSVNHLINRVCNTIWKNIPLQSIEHWTRWELSLIVWTALMFFLVIKFLYFSTLQSFLSNSLTSLWFCANSWFSKLVDILEHGSWIFYW